MSMIKRYLEEVYQEAETIEEYYQLDKAFCEHYGIEFNWSGPMDGWKPKEKQVYDLPMQKPKQRIPIRPTSMQYDPVLGF